LLLRPTLTSSNVFLKQWIPPDNTPLEKDIYY
jgi:hypothetical protein